MSITTLLAISLGAILTNNFIFAQFLGCCPFLGVSKKVDTAVGMGVAVTFVMGLASAVCFVVNKYILIPLDLAYMQTVAFILVIASLVQFIEKQKFGIRNIVFDQADGLAAQIRPGIDAISCKHKSRCFREKVCVFLLVQRS